MLDGGQQDAHEFWMRIMSVFEKKRNSSTMFDRWFLHDVITYVNCGYCYQNSETVREVSQHIIDISGYNSIKEAVDAYFEGDTVETYQCLTCNSINNEKAHKKYCLNNVPKILTLVLNRFKNKSKIHQNDVELSKQLTLTNFSSSRGVVRANYNLVSVINHIGQNISSGHYTTIACSSSTFYEFDDSYVKRTDAINGCNAYILFYELSAKVF